MSPNPNEQSPQKSFAHTSGPFHLIDASMDTTSPNPLSPIYQQPYHRSGYISKLKIQQNVAFIASKRASSNISPKDFATVVSALL